MNGATATVAIVTTSASSTDTEEDYNENSASPNHLDPSYFYKNLRRKSDISTVPSTEDRNESKVLVLFTGGTIGMKRATGGVYVPMPRMMEDALRKFPNLNDEKYVSKYFSEQHPPPLVLPETDEKRRVVYTIYEYNPLLDSSNMTMDDWIRVAGDIKQFYHTVDGFVILHGTDTMSYTASALAFMLENLGKPVVVTGSQIPIFEPRSDGQNNFLGALIIAGNYPIPEVSLFFNHKLYRGNCTTKVDAGEFEAFASPNLRPLAKVGIHIQVDWKIIHRSADIEKFTVWTVLNRNVGLLRLFPSITLETIQAFLQPPIQGVVLQTYGNGNVPSNRKDVLYELKRASDRGILIVNITQCSKGCVRMDYETGQVLVNCGVLSGSNMTPEAALTKLSYVLAKDWPIATKRKMMQTNLRGEMSSCTPESMEEFDLVSAISQTLQLSQLHELSSLKEFLFPSLLCAAARSGNIQKMELLQQHGGDVTAYNYDYRTPLHVAAGEGHVEVVEYLLHHGGNVHARDRNERTPLMDAIAGNHHKVIELLCSGGAHVSRAPHSVGEALCRAAASGKLSTLKSFAIAGASMDLTDHSGRTALQLAVMHNKSDCVQFLLKLGADPDLTDCLGNTARNIAQQIYGSADLLTNDNN